MIFRGEIPEQMDVCHNCDQTLCVNPDHLFAGTNLDNIEDAGIKGRWKLKGRKGQDNATSKLTDAIVLELRAAPKHYGYFMKWARRLGVNRSTIMNAYFGRTFSHL